MVRSNALGIDGPRINGTMTTHDRHASAARTAVLDDTGDENLVGDEQHWVESLVAFSLRLSLDGGPRSLLSVRHPTCRESRLTV